MLVSKSLPLKDADATFLLEMFIQSWFYTCEDTVPAVAGVRKELYTMLTLDSHQVVCRRGYIQ